MWCAESGSFRFRIELHDRPLTRRVVLSTTGPILILMGTWPLLHSSSADVQRQFGLGKPRSRESTPTVGKVAARNRIVGETGDTAMFKLDNSWNLDSGYNTCGSSPFKVALF